MKSKLIKKTEKMIESLKDQHIRLENLIKEVKERNKILNERG